MEHRKISRRNISLTQTNTCKPRELGHVETIKIRDIKYSTIHRLLTITYLIKYLIKIDI